MVGGQPCSGLPVMVHRRQSHGGNGRSWWLERRRRGAAELVVVGSIAGWHRAFLSNRYPLRGILQSVGQIQERRAERLSSIRPSAFGGLYPVRIWNWTAPAFVAAGIAAVTRTRRHRRNAVSAGQRNCSTATVLADGSTAEGAPALCPESVTAGQMPGRYEFSAVEEDLYGWWESRGFFRPEIADMVPPGQGGHEPYVMTMPPPNVTGRLHMGHAQFASLEDAMTRFHRMYGHRTLWLPGTDHAGIATQMLVERALAAEGKSRQEVGRDAFLERVWEWKAEKGGAIVEQLRRMGASCDWTREQFTLNEHMSQAVVEAFVRLHEKGLIFRGQRMVNWSPVLQTAVSDLEVEFAERQGTLFHFKYMLKGGEADQHIPVATTRPETILGDAAVCVNPADPRYKDFIGKEVIVPMQGRSIPVIADDYVDMEFGTGALKVTPAHDFNDFEIATRHDLPFYVVIGLDGSMSPAVAELGSEKYAGMDRFKCRKVLWADMEEQGFVIKEEDHMQRVPLSQRSGEVIEPLISSQWFLNTEDMAQRAMDAVESGEITIQPPRYNNIWFNWLKEKQPWCISRQLWWGHRIPVYYPVGQRQTEGAPFFVARSMEEALEQARNQLGDDVELEQDPDVLDTWFSSGLWPFATVGWPNEKAPDLDKYFPGAMLETGYDILFFWVARMVMMSLSLTDKVPFKEIYLHGLVRDENNQKMSKTKGNVVDPLDSIADYGTDALRFSLITSTVPGVDIPLSKGMLENGKSLANKVWNIGRFIITEYEKNESANAIGYKAGAAFTVDEIKAMPWVERAVISKLHGVIESVTKGLLQNQFDAPTKMLASFLRDDLASWYVECAKTRLQPHLGGNPKEARGIFAQRVLLYTLETALRLLHPFMPFVTEAVWQRLPRDASHPGSLMVSAWPDMREEAIKIRDLDAESWFSSLCSSVSKIRNVRAEQDIPNKERLPLTFWCNDAALAEALSSEREVIAWNAKADPEKIQVHGFDKRGEVPSSTSRIVVADGLEVDLPLPEQTPMDMEKELERLRKQLAQLTAQLETQEKKITPSFLEKAPAKAKEKILQKVEDLKQQKASVAEQLQELEKQPASRREVVAALATFGLFTEVPRPANANVGEGDTLPAGARQEDRLRKGMDAWKEQGRKVEVGEVSNDEEWQNTQGFLRRLYSLNDDMTYLSRGLVADKKKKAEEIITQFKKQVKLADKPAKAKDVQAFMAYHKEITDFLQDFVVLLNDAPQDLVEPGQELEVAIV